jgi:hypothetical protein
MWALFDWDVLAYSRPVGSNCRDSYLPNGLFHVSHTEIHRRAVLNSGLHCSGFGVSALIYYTTNRIWPVRGSGQAFEEIDESEWRPAEHHRQDSDEYEYGDSKKQVDDAYVREVPVA